MNLIGIDVAGIDAQAWVRGSQALYAAAALAWLGLVLWRRSARLLLAGVILANAWAFVATCWPLQRLYALGPSRDRLNNLGLCQVVAAGNPALESAQPGQLHFEPFWGLLMALLSGFDPERLLRLYAFMPLVTLLGFVAALEVGLRRPRAPDDAAPAAADRDAGAWERALVAGFATLLCASPLDYLWSYRVTWAMMFLLKPNHAVGLVLLPLVLRAFAGARRLRGCVGAGLLLHLMGWAFVIHMGLAAAGLVVYALLSLATGHPDRRRDLRDVAVVLGVNLLAVSPYLYMLLADYPFLVPRHRATVPALSPHLLEVTFRAGWLFPLGVWGAWRLWRRGDRLGRLWAAQGLSALLMWAGCLALSGLQLAREMDEFYQWSRFVTAVCAAVAAWDLAQRGWSWLRERGPGAPGLVAPAGGWAWPGGSWRARTGGAAWPAVAVALAVVPLSLPYWWDPPRMDPFFTESLTPLPESVVAPMAWLRRHSAPGDAVAGDREYMPWVSALAARRVLLSARLNAPDDVAARSALEAALVRGGDPDAARRAAERYGVRFLLVTPALLRSYGVELEDLERRGDLRLGHITREGRRRFIAVFRLEPRDAGPSTAAGSRAAPAGRPSLPGGPPGTDPPS